MLLEPMMKHETSKNFLIRSATPNDLDEILEMIRKYDDPATLRDTLAVIESGFVPLISDPATDLKLVLNPSREIIGIWMRTPSEPKRFITAPDFIRSLEARIEELPGDAERIQL